MEWQKIPDEASATSAAGPGVNSAGISEAGGSGAGDNGGKSLVGYAGKEQTNSKSAEKRAGVGWQDGWKKESWPLVSADGALTEWNQSHMA